MYKLNTNDFVKKYLSSTNLMYVSDKISIDSSEEIDLMHLCLYRVNEVCFDDKAPRKEALENVMTSLRIPGINVVFLIVGEKDNVSFYYGVSKDKTSDFKQELGIYEIGNTILQPAILGNFRGSKVSEIDPDQKKKILEQINSLKYGRVIEGVPGANKDDEKFQGIDRLVNVMYGSEFCFMIIAKPLELDSILDLQENLYHLYTDILSPLAKMNIQSSSGESNGTSTSHTEGESKGENNSSTDSSGTSHSDSDGTNTSDSKSENDSDSKNRSDSSSEETGSSSTSHSTQEGTSHTRGRSKTTGTSESHTDGTNTGHSDTKGTSTGSSKSDTTSDSKTKSTSSNTSFEINNKEVQDWIKYLDEVLFPRIDYGKGKGLFITSMAVFANNKSVLEKLQNTVIALYSGENGNRVPLKATDMNDLSTQMVKSFCLPQGKIYFTNPDDELKARIAMSQYIDKTGNAYLGNWITTNELGLIAGLPQKEIVGLALKEEVEFGLNTDNSIKDENKIELGHLIQNGNILEYNNVYLDKSVLDQHIFVSGVTGSGKTTTCQQILNKSNLPFLVVEPAKTEYRIMKKDYNDLLVFTIGNNNVAPLKMNPFVFYRHESITSRVDMLKACIESAFEMEAAIPQIIESAMYKSYEDYGWNISTNQNSMFDDPFEDGSEAFPTLDDLIRNTKIVVEEQGFDARLKNDYIGSINARLLGLLAGNKGQMLNTHQSIDFVDLLDKRVVFELEDIRSASEKSLIMGFILINLSEAIKEKYRQSGAFKHITLIEEAHRLLSKCLPGDDPNKKHGVEMFSDMLAEIRKYGESLVIVDQIPNKLTPEVLKNTNTKIIHRIFASDDKDAIGNTVMLDDSQKKFLSNLKTGEAIFFSNGFDKAVQIKINPSYNTSDKVIDDSEIIDTVRDYYSVHYKKNLIMGLKLFDGKPSVDEYNSIKLLSDGLADEYWKYVVKYNVPLKIKKEIKAVMNRIGSDRFNEYLWEYIICKQKYLLHQAKNGRQILNNIITDSLSDNDTLNEFSKYFKKQSGGI